MARITLANLNYDLTKYNTTSGTAGIFYIPKWKWYYLEKTNPKKNNLTETTWDAVRANETTMATLESTIFMQWANEIFDGLGRVSGVLEKNLEILWVDQTLHPELVRHLTDAINYQITYWKLNQPFEVGNSSNLIVGDGIQFSNDASNWTAGEDWICKMTRGILDTSLAVLWSKDLSDPCNGFDVTKVYGSLDSLKTWILANVAAGKANISLDNVNVPASNAGKYLRVFIDGTIEYTDGPNSGGTTDFATLRVFGSMTDYNAWKATVPAGKGEVVYVNDYGTITGNDRVVLYFNEASGATEKVLTDNGAIIDLQNRIGKMENVKYTTSTNGATNLDLEHATANGDVLAAVKYVDAEDANVIATMNAAIDELKTTLANEIINNPNKTFTLNTGNNILTATIPISTFSKALEQLDDVEMTLTGSNGTSKNTVYFRFGAPITNSWVKPDSSRFTTNNAVVINANNYVFTMATSPSTLTFTPGLTWSINSIKLVRHSTTIDLSGYVKIPTNDGTFNVKKSGTTITYEAAVDAYSKIDMDVRLLKNPEFEDLIISSKLPSTTFFDSSVSTDDKRADLNNYFNSLGTNDNERLLAFKTEFIEITWTETDGDKTAAFRIRSFTYNGGNPALIYLDDLSNQGYILCWSATAGFWLGGSIWKIVKPGSGNPGARPTFVVKRFKIFKSIYEGISGFALQKPTTDGTFNVKKSGSTITYEAATTGGTGQSLTQSTDLTTHANGIDLFNTGSALYHLKVINNNGKPALRIINNNPADSITYTTLDLTDLLKPIKPANVVAWETANAAGETRFYGGKWQHRINGMLKYKSGTLTDVARFLESGGIDPYDYIIYANFLPVSSGYWESTPLSVYVVRDDINFYKINVAGTIEKLPPTTVLSDVFFVTIHYETPWQDF